MFFYITDKHLFMLINVGIRTGRDHINFSISCSSGLAVLASPGRIRLLFQCAKLVTPNLFLRNILATMTSLKVLIALAAIVGIASSVSVGSFFGTYPMIFYGLSMSVTNNVDKAWQFCGNNTDVEKYREVAREARKCLNGLFDKNQSICHNIEDNVQKCSQTLVDYFVNCLPEKSKDAPPAIAKSAASLVEAFCTSSGELLLESSNDCILQYFEGKIATKQECKKESLKPKLDKWDDEIPSKSEGCQVLTELAGCWKEAVNESCENSVAKEFVSKVCTAALAPCNENR